MSLKMAFNCVFGRTGWDHSPGLCGGGNVDDAGLGCLCRRAGLGLHDRSSSK